MTLMTHQLVSYTYNWDYDQYKILIATYVRTYSNKAAS